MKPETACRRLVDEFRSRQTVRAGSLITTVFGDAIAPRGGSVWLGSLIRVMAGFGISERLVRTSVFRLAKDGWLESRQAGRRSYYSLTEEGRERFDVATHRIYRAPTVEWDGRWTLLLLSELPTARRDIARKEFGWLGFGALSANVLAHPSPDAADLRMTAKRIGVDGDLVVFDARTLDSDRAMRSLSNHAWNLDDIDERYAAFIDQFRDAFRALDGDDGLSGEPAFLMRTLLIQEYRKILLRDPQLPGELLPADWHGRAAYELCAKLYRRVHASADDWLSDVMETEHGVLPGNDARFFRRFGGLSGEGA